MRTIFMPSRNPIPCTIQGGQVIYLMENYFVT